MGYAIMEKIHYSMPERGKDSINLCFRFAIVRVPTFHFSSAARENEECICMTTMTSKK